MGRVAPRAPLGSAPDGVRGATRPTNPNRATAAVVWQRRCRWPRPEPLAGRVKAQVWLGQTALPPRSGQELPVLTEKPVFLPFLAPNPSSKIILDVSNFISEVAESILEVTEPVSEVAESILELAGLGSEDAEFGLAIADFVSAIADFRPDRAGASGGAA